MKTMNKNILRELHIQGRKADVIFAENGLVVTQGGEPTFIPENHSAPEWNLEALGEEKLTLAWKLCRALEEQLLPGAVILRSNGKHYPGEPIPRWKLTLLRRQGEPLWRNSDLLSHGYPGKKKPVSPKKFLATLARKLGVPGSLRPVYEDVEAAMRSALLAGETPPLPRYSSSKKGFVQPKWTSKEKKRWQALHRVAGWILPLDCIEGVWKTDDWVLPDGGDLLLLPGTSSIGLRLPLHRLPAGTLPRALTIEIRDGTLTLFLPPLLEASYFAELLAAIEQTARQLGSAPLSLEGYPPPHDDSWESLSVIPDPGVIEVNLPPAADWESLEKTVTVLFAAASACGLKGTRKLPSGETVATGGGGHLVLGGASLEQNPFILRPHLLSSFLRFVQRHPSLSYLFSGRFVGPSSQAPRIDESFFEIPGALAVGLRAIEAMPSPANPALIDAILRNLLLDLHGNTHKAEVSVDKFFNPFMPNGRLGLVEFRSIEMTPDAPMFLAIHALWRALAACFVARPYTEPLVEWRGKLHDEFLLPSFLERDLDKVLSYLGKGGFQFDREWFLPQLFFRFPIIAEQKAGDWDWHLRRAIEPWPLLGEQPSPGGGIVRCVDSSTERLELRVFPSTQDRNETSPPVISVNGWKLPLTPHPAGGFVGAVRFRNILFPSCLQPQVMPHTPLEIQFFQDSGVSLGAWHYHPVVSKTGKARRHLVAATKQSMRESDKKREKPKAHPSKEPVRTLDLLSV